MKQPIVQAAWDCYAAYKRGILPNDKGMRKETAFFQQIVSTMEALEGAAESWYMKQMEAKRKNDG